MCAISSARVGFALAVEALGLVAPSFLLTDLKMSRGDGFSLLAFLRSTPNSAIIPTVVFSASDDLDDIKEAYMLGSSAYFIKPHQHDELTRIVRVLVEFWMLCEVPEVDEAGTRRLTESAGKLGERFPQLLAVA